MAEELSKTDAPEADAAAEPAKPAPPAVAVADMPLLRIEGVGEEIRQLPRRSIICSLDIRAGEFFFFFCRCWARAAAARPPCCGCSPGFETPDEGRILLAGKDIAPGAAATSGPVNMMFQNYAPVSPFVGAGQYRLRPQGRAGMAARPTSRARVAEMVALVRLDGLEKRKPDQPPPAARSSASRWAALAGAPVRRFLLLDEPLAALDKKLRESTAARN